MKIEYKMTTAGGWALTLSADTETRAVQEVRGMLAEKRVILRGGQVTLLKVTTEKVRLWEEGEAPIHERDPNVG